MQSLSSGDKSEIGVAEWAVRQGEEILEVEF